ncbi:FAD-dependent monooxygenase [Amycolatopsis panacis]|uniref:FAD-binding domain-containing protein n=1 Tax=Amycolatopsis panacis TaxID=2340917 RepID=A0A419I383_9PSEU|nr:hypothetical protein D5S19_17705 [Amycolatopsis panacis]
MFLVGDGAHVWPPAGALGANTGARPRTRFSAPTTPSVGSWPRGWRRRSSRARRRG